MTTDSITLAQQTVRLLTAELAIVERNLGFQIPPFGVLAEIATALAAAKRIAQRKERTNGVGTSAADTDRSIQLNTVAGSYTRNPSSRWQKRPAPVTGAGLSVNPITDSRTTTRGYIRRSPP